MPNDNLPKTKQPFNIKIEYLIPTTITYTVMAENPEDALKEVDKFSARKLSTQQHLNRKIKLKASVYTSGTSMLKFSKIYRNI